MDKYSDSHIAGSHRNSEASTANTTHGTLVSERNKIGEGSGGLVLAELALARPELRTCGAALLVHEGVHLVGARLATPLLAPLPMMGHVPRARAATSRF